MCALDVSYWAMEGCLTKRRKVILQNVSCLYRKGVNIIIGPTGSGKTTLLDLMAGRKNPVQTTGQVLMDGKPRPADFKNRVGYVTQDDVMMGSLTVKENITFSASLRLPTTLGSRWKRQRVHDVIAELGLEKCANTKIGSDFIRGVSGGERKRCNIGMEMIISPPVLFLDEPTTGLDASTANSVIKLLKRMSDQGQVVIMSIHQPRYSIYEIVDSTTMLAGGRLLYHGPANEALEFFKNKGFVCSAFNNPADFFLDVINDDTLNDDGQTNVELLIESFKSSQWQNEMDNELEQIVTAVAGVPEKSDHKRWIHCRQSHYPTGWFYQFGILSLRGMKDNIKNPQIIGAMLIKSVVLSLFVGSLFWQLGDDSRRSLYDRTGALFFLMLTQQFVNLSAVNVFISQRKLFRHEVSSGYYRVSAYFVSKVLFDLIPLRLLPVAIVTFSSHFAIGLRPGLEHLLILFLMLYAVCMTAASVCFMVGCTVSKEETGHIIVSMTIALGNLYSGFLIKFSSMPKALAWIQYISIAKYGFQVLHVNEFADRTFYLKGINMTFSGNDYLEEMDISSDTGVMDYLIPFLALGAISWVSMIVGYIQLRRMKIHS